MIYWFVCRKLQAVGSWLSFISFRFLCGSASHLGQQMSSDKRQEKLQKSKQNWHTTSLKRGKSWHFLPSRGENSVKCSPKNSKHEDGKIRKLYLPNVCREVCLGFDSPSVWGLCLQPSGISLELQTGNGSFCVSPPRFTPPPRRCVDDFHWLWNLNALRKCFAFAFLVEQTYKLQRIFMVVLAPSLW